MTISTVFSATGHGCAPGTPPPVAGTLAQPEAAPHIIFINEVLPAPSSIWSCSEQGSNSAKNNAWVELYNPQDKAFDLYAGHSSLDSGPNTTPFYLPVGAALAAHSFLVIFPPISMFAQLSSAAGSSTLRLLIESTLVDQVTLIPLLSDTSYARMPDGGDTWQVTDTPTIDASNIPPTPTPTPTRTPKPSSVKTASKKTSSQKTSTQKSTGTLDGTTSDTSNQTAGTQPAWNTLSVPPTTSSISDTTTQGNISNPAPQATDTGDLPRKVLLTSLAAALLLGLLLCSRYFTKAKKLSGNHTEASLAQQNDDFSEETVNMPTMPDDHPLTDRK
jgi:hypothetical protein